MVKTVAGVEMTAVTVLERLRAPEDLSEEMAVAKLQQCS
jgi:hypothetical protein